MSIQLTRILFKTYIPPRYMEPLKVKGVIYIHANVIHPLRGLAQRGDGRRRVPHSHVCHSGDGESHTGWGERFEHPTKTWACATHKQFTMQMVAVAIAKATWKSG